MVPNLFKQRIFLVTGGVLSSVATIAIAVPHMLHPEDRIFCDGREMCSPLTFDPAHGPDTDYPTIIIRGRTVAGSSVAPGSLAAASSVRSSMRGCLTLS
jgi:hypothetical protein